MFHFVNRYLEPLVDVKYKIIYEEKTIIGTTTEASNAVTILPKTLAKIQVLVWSRRTGAFKLIDTCVPKLGVPQLINERMKTFKHDSQTHPHPEKKLRPPVAPPRKTAPVKPASPPPGPSPTANQGVNPEQTRNNEGEPEHHTDRPVPAKITETQLKKIFPAATDDFLTKVADELNTNLSKYKLDSILRRAHFFAQVRQEAGSKLSPKEENLNYLPEVLKSKFIYYARHPTEAESDGRLEEVTTITKRVKGVTKRVSKKTIKRAADQETIANKAYSNRGGNGAPSTGEGWAFRGRGIFQLTTKNNYQKFNDEYKDYWSEDNPDFVKNPEKLVQFPYFIRSAVWYWIKNSIYSIADKGSEDDVIDEITKSINGPTKDAAEERRKNFNDLSYPAFQ